jgi:hypothetical protein
MEIDASIDFVSLLDGLIPTFDGNKLRNDLQIGSQVHFSRFGLWLCMLFAHTYAAAGSFFFLVHLAIPLILYLSHEEGFKDG